MNPSHGAVAARDLEVQLDRGLRLPGRVWAAERPRGLIAAIHGLGEHSGRYAALASDLVAARFTVVAVDLPGHGDAPGPRGDIPSWAAVRDLAVPALFGVLRESGPAGLPHLLFGHSMGGVMALDYALQHPKSLLAVAVSAPGLRSAIPPWWKLALANVARVTTPSAGFPHGLEEAGMSRDPEVLRLRRDDPRVHDRISPRLYFEFNDARQRVLRDARRLAVPALVQHGAADRVVDPRGSLEFTAAAPHGMVRLMTYRDAYHELFNDEARAAALKDLIGWLDAVVVA
jgi:alpha-beta hydrolase superfamily lysophospholipase